MRLKLFFLCIIHVLNANITQAALKTKSRHQNAHLAFPAKPILRQDITAYGDKDSYNFVQQDDALGSDEGSNEPEEYYTPGKAYSKEALDNELDSKEFEYEEVKESLSEKVNRLLREKNLNKKLRQFDWDELVRLRDHTNHLLEHHMKSFDLRLAIEPDDDVSKEAADDDVEGELDDDVTKEAADDDVEGELEDDVDGELAQDIDGGGISDDSKEAAHDIDGGGISDDDTRELAHDIDGDDGVSDDDDSEAGKVSGLIGQNGDPASSSIAQSILQMKPQEDKFSWNFGLLATDKEPLAFAKFQLKAENNYRRSGNPYRRNGGSLLLPDRDIADNLTQGNDVEDHSVYGNLEYLGNPNKIVPGRTSAIMSSGFRRTFNTGQERYNLKTKNEKRKRKSVKKSARLFESVPEWRITQEKEEEERKPFVILLTKNERDGFMMVDEAEDSDSDSDSDASLPMDYRRKLRNGEVETKQQQPAPDAPALREKTDFTESSAEKNPGNPYTIFRNKYQQNWPWKYDMDGDHMNINPYSPDLGNVMGPTGSAIFFNRKWWYFNQDDYKPFR